MVLFGKCDAMTGSLIKLLLGILKCLTHNLQYLLFKAKIDEKRKLSYSTVPYIKVPYKRISLYSVLKVYLRS